MKRILPVLLLALALVWGVSACSGGPTAALAAAVQAKASPSRPPDTESASPPAAGSACALLTVADVATATGTAMKVSGDAGSICTFSGVSDEGLVVYLWVRDGTDLSQHKQQIESASEHLTGLGDDAFWNTAVGEVFVQKGTRGFSIQLPSLANLTATPTAVKSKMVTLAETALTRF